MGALKIFVHGDQPKFREGDFIESTEGLIFDVKGLVHPPGRTIAYVRYFPTPDGDRERYGTRYGKVYDLDERYAFLRKHFPQYLFYDSVFGEELNEVPIENVVRHYQPSPALAELHSRCSHLTIENKILNFADFVADSAHIPLAKLGISGSILVNLALSTSDLDIIVYGVKNALKVNHSLENCLEEGRSLRKYGSEVLEKLHKSRCRESRVSFEDYAFHERRKFFQGFFNGTDFFVRYIKDWGEFKEVYYDSVYTPLGQAKIRGVISDDSDALFTPCSYRVEDVEMIDGTPDETISSIVSFRGRFCQQALVGELVVASGKLERVMRHGEINYRLILGNHPEDFMVAVR